MERIKTKNKTEKVEWIIKNWNKMSIIQMSNELKVAPLTISQWATRLRKKGVKLSYKRQEKIRWDYLQEKYSNKEI